MNPIYIEADPGTQLQVIDMHTHMFNALYMPLIGILRNYRVPENLCKPGAKLAWVITKYSRFKNFSPSVPEHLKLENIARSGQQSEQELKTYYIDALVQNYENCWRYHNTSHKEFALNPALSIGENFQRELVQRGISNLPVNPDQNDTLESHELLLWESAADLIELFPNDSPAVKSLWISNPLGSWIKNLGEKFRKLLNKMLDHVETGLDFIDFFWNMAQKEEHILGKLKSFYDVLGVKYAFVHYMMDMEGPFEAIMGDGLKDAGKVKLPFYERKKGRSQLSQMDALASGSEGVLKGFSAFDPWRFKDASETEVFNWLHEIRKDYQMLGFKFYPPMGFDARGEPPHLASAIDSFLKYCVIHDVPVFTHCTPSGFEVKSGSGQHSDPKHWGAALASKNWVYEGKEWSARNLRLCLGHAGGGLYKSKKKRALISAGWVADPGKWATDKNNYARTVVELCAQYPNVYCELANIDSILDLAQPAHKTNMTNNLHRELTAVQSPYRLRDKIIYGTDWHMVGMVNDVIVYFHELYDMFDQLGDETLKSKFFHGNALRYLKHGEGGENFFA